MILQKTVFFKQKYRVRVFAKHGVPAYVLIRILLTSIELSSIQSENIHSKFELLYVWNSDKMIMIFID